ncbi:MAG: hypothetical protein ABI355_06635, partial [Solirubrobacteraceae bacterium]
MAMPVLAAGLLGLFAVSESTARSALAGVGTQRAVVLCLVALATTLPPAFMPREAAAMTVVSASVMSIVLFHTLTAAAVLAQLTVLFRLGRDGAPRNRAQPVAVGLSAAFLVLALTHPVPSGSEAGVLTVLLASLAPAATFAGIARRARGEALALEAALEAVGGD